MQRKKRNSVLSLSLVLATMIGLCASQSALATSYLDSGVATGFTQVSTDFGTLSSAAWPVIILVAFTVVAIKLFKRASSKI